MPGQYLHLLLDLALSPDLLMLSSLPLLQTNPISPRGALAAALPGRLEDGEEERRYLLVSEDIKHETAAGPETAEQCLGLSVLQEK